MVDEIVSVPQLSCEVVAKNRHFGRAGVPSPTADGDGTPSLTSFANASCVASVARMNQCAVTSGLRTLR